jgi:hypothetical protein
MGFGAKAMDKPVNYAEALDAHRNMPSGPAKLSHIEVTHHMTNGSAQVERVEPGKMVQHVADCPHCSGSTAAAG